MNTNTPKVGQVVKVRGRTCRIYKIRECGTIDVEDIADGQCYRITGLPFQTAQPFDERLRDWDDTAKNWEDV